MKVFGHPWSINTRKVLMTLAEKGHEAELVLVMIPKGKHRAPPHLARHPFGKVPVLEDGGLVLYETGPINRYLDRVLSSSAYFAGSSFSLADIHWLPYFEYLTRIGGAALLDGRPHLRAWWERARARRSSRGVTASE